MERDQNNFKRPPIGNKYKRSKQTKSLNEKMQFNFKLEEA
jgi:hypothetical protein